MRTRSPTRGNCGGVCTCASASLAAANVPSATPSIARPIHDMLLPLQLVESSLELVHHSGMPEPPRRVDAVAKRGARFVDAAKLDQRLGEAAVPVPLVGMRREVEPQIVRGLLVQLRLEGL